MSNAALRAGPFSLMALLAVLGQGACGGDDSPPPDDTTSSGGSGTGSDAPGGTDSTGGTVQTGGTGDASGASGAGGSGACQHTVPPNEQITDFAGVTGNASSWGTDTTLTGGSFTYTGTDSTIELLVANEALGITGSIAADQYAGFGLWFGPCTDASQYLGVTFALSGDPGETQIVFQLQTSRNYPIDETNQKGECVGSWGSPCASHEAEVVGVTDTPTVYQLRWEDLSGGAPITDVEPSEILGVQWQLNCGPDGCSPNIVLDDVAFY
jgi:hypothetical protein